MEFFTNLATKVNDVLFDTAHEANPTAAEPDDDTKEQQLAQEKHRYDSFAAVRHNAQVKAFVDGQNYCW